LRRALGAGLRPRRMVDAAPSPGTSETQFRHVPQAACRNCAVLVPAYCVTLLKPQAPSLKPQASSLKPFPLDMPLPAHIASLLELALRPLPANVNIAEPTRQLADVVWHRWLARRSPDDNRAEHEFIVLANVIRIGLAEGLLETELRIAAAFALLHDTQYIPRITEARTTAVARQAAAARRDGRDSEAERLEAELASLEHGKFAQRHQHMRGGALTAEYVLRRLPDEAGAERWLNDIEAEKCVAIIRGHDRWKLGDPHPASSDWLAVVCLEADALWPLHPLGVQADLERPGDNGQIKDLNDPQAWRDQLAVSVNTLRKYRANWPVEGRDPFQDRQSIFRSPSGHASYVEWLKFWGIECG